MSCSSGFQGRDEIYSKMKLVSIIKKNFKLLIRSKASAFTVLIGPLLIILLVGLVFSGKSSYELSIGYYTPTHNNLTADFVDSLKQSEFFVQEFSAEEGCVRKIEQGIIHTCIIFPQDFKIKDEERNELRFLVDYSRMNLVYKVIDSVSGILEIESKELSYSLTQVLLSKINTTIRDVGSDLVLIEELNSKINLLMRDLQSARANTDAMKLDTKNISFSRVEAEASSLEEAVILLQEKDIALINKSEDLVDMLSDYLDANESAEIEDEVDELKISILDLHVETDDEIQDFLNSIDEISASLSILEADLEQSRQLNTDTQVKLDSAKNNLAGIQSSLIDLKNALKKSKDNLEGIAVTRAETIVSPVNTKIEPVVSDTSKLTYTFSFLLVLVVMFVALLLSSTIIMFEKSSKAFFRNIITPTRPGLFVITTFITSFVVIVLQTIIILGLANYFLYIPLLKNALITLLIIFVTTTFFIVLGMAVGYLFSTQEGAIMASIVLGALFMFLSNLVVPLESLAPFFSNIIKYNPYVLASELLRKSLLFKVTFSEALPVILILFGASVIIFLLITLLHMLTSRKRIKPLKEELADKILHERISEAKKEPSPALKPTAGRAELEATTKLELLKQVADMTKAEFEDNFSAKQNKIADYAEKKLKDKRLAHKLRKTVSKKEMIKILIEDVKKKQRGAEKS